MSITLENIQEQLASILTTLETKLIQLRVTGNQITVGEGLSDIDHRLGIIQAGEFRVGNGKLPGDGFTGGRYGFPGFVYGADTYFLAGVLNDVLQVGMSLTNGKILGGAGDVVVDGDGIWIKNQQAAFGFEDTNGDRFNIYLASDGSDNLDLVNQSGVGGVFAFVDTSAHQVLQFAMTEDGADAGTPLFAFYNSDPGSSSAHFAMDSGVDIWTGRDGKETVFNDDSFDIDFRIESAANTNAFFLDASSETISFFGTPSSPSTILTVDNIEKRFEFGGDHYIAIRSAANPNTYFNEANQDMDFQIESTSLIAFKVDAGDNAVYMDGDLVFRTDGSGLPYASIYGNEIDWTQASAAQNTWYKISDADMADGQLNLVTHDGNGKLTVSKAGRYKIDFAASLEVSLPNKHVQIGVAVNGTEANDGICHYSANIANEQFHLSSTVILDVPASATIDISVRTTDTGAPNLLCDHLNVSLVQVGGT